MSGRKVVLYTLQSLDGAVDEPARYFASNPQPGQPPVFDAAMEDNEKAVTSTQDAVLLGRGMYEEWSGYWPMVENEPFADFINSVRKYVITSTSLTRHWANAAAVSGPMPDFVRELKSRPGGDIGVHGSITLAQSLLAARLVDELRLVVGPVAGCPGRRLFAGNDVRRLTLLNATATPSGALLLHYRVPPGGHSA
jgi:dihydrofolate reductase